MCCVLRKCVSNALKEFLDIIVKVRKARLVTRLLEYNNIVQTLVYMSQDLILGLQNPPTGLVIYQGYYQVSRTLTPSFAR